MLSGCMKSKQPLTPDISSRILERLRGTFSYQILFDSFLRNLSKLAADSGNTKDKFVRLLRI